MKPSDRWDSLLTYEAERVGLPFHVVKAQMLAESAGNPDAVSPCGAMGLMQLMPLTARELKVKDPFRPDHSVRGGCEYLSQQWHRIKAKWPLMPDSDSLRMALAAYNMGLGYCFAAAKTLPSPPTWDAMAEALKTVTFNGKKPDWRQATAYVDKILPRLP